MILHCFPFFVYHFMPLLTNIVIPMETVGADWEKAGGPVTEVDVCVAPRPNSMGLPGGDP
jgi:hypothetical protein